MVQVHDVKLPDRTRARLEAEGNQQRVLKPHDIRTAIPLVDYTNPAKFPPYMFREYPKMPLLDKNRPIIIDESGGVLVFYDAADEVDFKDMNPEIAEEIERNAPTKAIADTIAAQASEIEELRAMLKANGIESQAKTKKKSANALEALARPNAASGASNATDRAPEPEEGLAARLPSNKKPGGPRNPLKKN